MFYAIISDGEIVKYPVNVRAEFPNISFPAQLAVSCLPDNVVEVRPTPMPEFDYTQAPVENTPENISGIWRQVWTVVDRDPADIAADVEAQWGNVRAERDARLAACDWTQVADAPLNTETKAEWVAYRQELRDLPSTVEDPFSFEWPEVPAP